LPLVRPKLFLDANICIYVANGKIQPAEWRRVQKRISNNYRYCISLITLKELLGKIARGSDDYFERNKAPLRVLYGPARPRFLVYPHVFALRTILRIQSAARMDTSGLPEEEWSRRVLEAVLDAPSKAQLKNGIPIRNHKRRMQTFDLDDFDVQENEPQNKHADLLQGIREGTIDIPEREKWAAWILHEQGLTPYTAACENLSVALDAAYRFSCSLSKMAKDKGYDFRAHASDWGDSTQLFYLCDEAMHFLTFDQDFRHRTKGTSQSSRILLYPEFVKSIGITEDTSPPH
jgi:predicted nucleic acid-binding protein